MIRTLRYYDTSLIQGLPIKYKHDKFGILEKKGTISL